jgi:hypothetical protein
MATVNKDFKIKSGLIVEGTTATVNNFDVLTKKQADQDYIVGLIGGTATSANTANTVVKRDANGNFAAGTITADLTGNVTGTVSSLSNHDTADLAENATNKYFTNQRALDATAAAYDAAGTAATEAGLVAGDLADHESDTSAHGVTGNVVGTSDTQTLTNKSIGDTLNFTGAGAMTINSDSHIVLTPAAGSSVKWGADVLATQAYTDQAESDAISTSETYTDTAITNLNLATTYDAKGAAAQALVDSKAYTDQEVSDLVGAAPALLDTLNELSAAIANNPSYATDAANAVAGRVAKAGDTMTGALTLSGAPTLNLHAATKGYVDGEISTLDTAAQGYANGAETDANSYTDTRETAITTAYQNYADQAEVDAKAYTDTRETAITTAYQNYADQAEVDAKAYADALTTSDVAEGTSQYFTTTRAKTAAAALIVGATKTNITITGDENGLTIAAENGVADSSTSDLVEGTNLYFTDARARTAVDGTTRSFTAVEVNSVAKQVAATVSCPVAGINQAYGFDPDLYRSAEFLVKVAYGNHTEISKVLLTLDINDNIAMTEYGIVGTNGSASSISADISGGEVRLLATTSNNNSTVTVMGTLLV